ncbi:N-acetyl-1-D-myo-inositol-2-amino-2-deoxy-alpha-D-glucopyranoside deacetylase [Nakamurella panacisegetis]|uniref:1D-myo-inositol 2-acetamido-2-deoxy-alpha-D-glucopyranoside deacetylase n=1 Tax=Nakamurella panacisegetis TaxID=1090615 RepID=A0A1H0IA16_9ACTN|nr:N-acetyl-1-D-myo-inositol-2-amino-2-deoxy-alpha-D-glucopyranoside deacetylase [Nakamurella panacisegetis]SDO28242.1 N-acetyl-1-D-myo-inositol-2-amino-2-deoxy-alpha-D-glucopyranoside deacetylase [Nakamurella panacisegetis]
MSLRRVLAVHAHPDDESITMGGTLARCVADGVAVTVVTATLGEEGEVIGEELQGLTAAFADQLGGYRYTELRAACAALGITDHRFLGGVGAFRDSGMIGTPSADHPRAFLRARSGGPDHEQAVRALVEVIEQVQPDVLLTYDADGGYGHPDHIATHEVAVAAAAGRVPRVLAAVRSAGAAQAALSRLAVPAGYRPATPADMGYLADAGDVAVTIDVRGVDGHRRSALAAHATQIEVLPGGFALSNRIAQPLTDVECFKLLSGAPLPPAATDLFAGLDS